MSEIQVSNLNKYFGDFHLLKDISFTVEPGEKTSIVGPNGSGKTTLLKIISGLLSFETGGLSIAQNRKIGLLEQLPTFEPHVTVREVLWQAFADIEEMGRQMAQMEEEMALGQNVNLNLYSRLQTAFEDAGGYDLDYVYRRMVTGLNIDEDMQARPFMSLSGGEKTRVNLARIMLLGTDILFLDEPTNHLDLQSIEWLEDYLQSFKGTILMVSHDRFFLDKVTTRTLELREGELFSWPGNYSYFVDAKAELMEQLEAAKKRQDREIARLEESISRIKIWGLGNKKVMKRAFAMEKRVERIERIETIRKEHKMRGRFSLANRSGDDVYAIQNLSVGYNFPLVRNFTAMVFRGERIAILGPNGSGKTTFLNTLLGTLPRLSGDIFDGAGLKKGYLPQAVTFENPHRNLVDTLLFETNCSTQQARDRLASFEFKGEDVFKTIDVLSGGEKTRLKLCLFMYTAVNTLFLDEPTNHLDILSREWVEDSIDDFSETMIFVSHDRHFINRFATRIWSIENGEIIDFLGGYEDFQKAKARSKSMASPPQKGQKEKAPKGQNPEKSQKENQKQTQKQKEKLHKEIAAHEERLKEISEEMDRCTGDDYVTLGALFEEKENLETLLLSLYEQVDD